MTRVALPPPSLDETTVPAGDIPPLRCGWCGREARIVRLKAGGIEHVIGRQRHPVILAPAQAPYRAHEPSPPVVESVGRPVHRARRVPGRPPEPVSG